MTLMIAAALGITAAAFFLPGFQQYASDRRLLSQLASPDSKERIQAVYRAQRRASENSTTRRRLIEALDTGDDRLFASVVTVLRSVGETSAVTNPPERVDRMLAIGMETTRSAESRRIIFMPALIADRDNAYIRRALKAAADDRDHDSQVRAMAGVLAAKIDDSETVSKLLNDVTDDNVRARTAIAVGLAGRKQHEKGLVGLLSHEFSGKEARSAAAYALIRLDARAYVSLVIPAMDFLDDQETRARLLHVLCISETDDAKIYVTLMLADAEKKGRLLTVHELIACRKLGIAQAQGQIRKILELAGKRDPTVTVPQALAAVDAAMSFKMPVRAEIYAICDNLWNADGDFVILLTHAARALGVQAAMPQGDRGDKPTREECVHLLQSMARYSVEAPSGTGVPPVSTTGTLPATSNVVAQTATTAPSATSAPASETTAELTTPLPSAAAAVALWELQSQLADEFVREASVDQKLVVGDYISWNLSQGSQKARAFELGLAMLPEMNAKVRVYSANERACGAMLLALSAGTDEQHTLARARLAQRVAGEERDPLAKGSYRCAMLILGEDKLLDDVRVLLEMGFPQRRVLTALWSSGDKSALDWLLWNPQLSPKDISDALVLRGCQEVLRAVAPALPKVDSIDPAGHDDLQLWQIRILRDDYVIHRAGLKLGLQK